MISKWGIREEVVAGSALGSGKTTNNRRRLAYIEL
jgi:hypothetical protein